jgi:putative ABC transport system permease protein
VESLASAHLLARDRSQVTVNGRYSGVAVISEEDLVALMGAGHTDAVEAFRDGGVVLLDPQRASDEASFQVRPKRSHPDGSWTLPAVSVTTADRAGEGGLLGGAFVSQDTAQELGLRPAYGQMVVHANEPFTQDVLDRLDVYGIDGYSYDPERSRVDLMQFSGLAAAGLLSALVVGVAVALASAESRDDVATLAAVGAGPWRRRSLGAMHGLFLGLVGCGLGVAVGVPAGLSFTQLDGASGIDVPWLATAGTLAAVLVMAPLAGWVVTPSRLRLTRRVT